MDTKRMGELWDRPTEATPQEVKTLVEMGYDLTRCRLQKTLRDELAMAALSGLTTRPPQTETALNEIAECAYALADVMLRQREKSESGLGA